MKKLLIVTNKKPSLKQGFLITILFLSCIAWFLVLDHIHYNCPFLTLFHIYCPGCGGMRMVISLLHLDYYQAFRYNPFLFILLVIGLIYLLIMIIIYIKKKVFVVPSVRVWLFILFLAICFMILRNIDAFIYLIPTEV